MIRPSSRPIHIPYEWVGPVLVTTARISNISQNRPTGWYLKHMARQRARHFHSFTCACYWYAVFYNENIGTRWIAGPLPLPSAWKDFITCLLRSDFGIYLCSVPGRCLPANRSALALPRSCSAHQELVFPIPHGEQHSWEWSWEQCWEQHRDWENPIPAQSSTFTVCHTAEQKCQHWDVPKVWGCQGLAPTHWAHLVDWPKIVT